MYNYLKMTAGSRAGTNFLLDPTDDNQIGRGVNCAIMVDDPLCSRIHAVIVQEDQLWRVRDAGSRNGTFVNGKKIESENFAQTNMDSETVEAAVLESGNIESGNVNSTVITDGDNLRVGSTEFKFYQTQQPPTVGSMPEGNLAVTQTLAGKLLNNPMEQLVEKDSLHLDHWQRRLIAEALRRTDGNISEAAKLLSVGRATLYRKLKEFNIPY